MACPWPARCQLKLFTRLPGQMPRLGESRFIAGKRSTPVATTAPHNMHAWHQSREVLRRFFQDAVNDEVSRLRPGGSVLVPTPWPDALRLNEAGLGLDSMERVAVAAAMSSALELGHSEHDLAIHGSHCVGDWLDLAQLGLAQDDTGLVFRTSGSTGRPKPCAHTLVNLEQEAAYLGSVFSGTRRILSAVPSHHIYGFLFTILLPRQLSTCESVLDIRATGPTRLASQLQAGDLIVAHPAHWSVLAEHLPVIPNGVRGVTSTAPCPTELAHKLAELGLLRLTQVYGSSETAGIGLRHDADAPYELMPHWACESSHGVTILHRRGADGNTASHALPDQLSWEGARQFRLSGRLDHAVQVGGVNVFPPRVQAILLMHPDVAQAHVRLMSPAEGTRLKAFVVPRPEAERLTLAQRLDLWVSTRLTAPERPKAFTIGEQLPANSMGKLADWPLS